MDESKRKVRPPTLEEIAQRAYALFDARGGAPGGELEDWTTAEQQLRAEQPWPEEPEASAKPKRSRPKRSAASTKGAEPPR